jgi:hypothetical protein
MELVESVQLSGYFWDGVVMMHTHLAMTLLEACDDNPKDILINVLFVGRRVGDHLVEY